MSIRGGLILGVALVAWARVAAAKATWEQAETGLLRSELEYRISLRELAWEMGRASGDLVDPGELKKIKRFAWASHQVRSNDNVWKLAAGYGTTVESLQSSNGSELIWMKLGSQVVVHNKKGTLHVVRAKDGRSQTLDEIARFYRPKDSARQAKLREEVIAANRLPGWALLRDYEFEPGSVVLLPGVYLEFDTFKIPLKAPMRVSSGFGARYHPISKREKFHDGLDLPQPHDTPVYASRSGRIIFAGWKEGYGLTVIIKHTDGMTTRYGHMSKIYVKEAQWVEGGKKMIGRVGSTGLSTGPHLHFEIRDQLGRAVNPKKKFGRK